MLSRRSADLWRHINCFPIAEDLTRALSWIREKVVMAVPVTANWMRNRLLDRLSKREYKSLIGSEKTVSLAAGEEVYRQGGPGSLRHVYFPTSGMVSLTVLMENGKEVEAATIGNEGMIGLPVALGL